MALTQNQFYLLLLSQIWIICAVSGDYAGPDSARAPSFINEPPSDVVFLNTHGTIIPCTATGHPTPSVAWRTEDGTTVVNVPGLRHVRWDGSLDFPPFSQEDFRKEIHSAIYRCVAINRGGALGSRDVRVRAVIREVYEVTVQESTVPIRNTAIIRCHVPSSVSNYVQVTAWLTDDGLTILAHDDQGYSGSKYQAFESGTLHVASIDESDRGRRYRCQVTNSLTNEKVVSVGWGRLKVTEPVNNQLTRMIQEPSVWEVMDGKTARLPCVAHGHPLPRYHWYREAGNQLNQVDTSRRWTVIDGTLVIHKVTASDGGKYVCFANNSVGEDKVDRLLRVRVPLKVELVTTKRVVRSGEEVSLNCSLSTPAKSVVWVKDQRRVVPDHRIRRPTLTHLKILVFQREDSGVYQCYAYNDWESAQAHVQLDLKEEMPTFTRIFPDQIHMPGQVISLHCAASGSPLPQVAWTLDGDHLSESRRLKTGDFVHVDGSVVSYVNISDLTVADGGLYSCEAKNDLGTVSHSARVDVFGPPFIRPMGNMTVVGGTNIIIRCPVSGYPVERTYVEKSGSKLPFGDRQSVDQRGVVRIHSVRKEDEGVYRCVAFNGRGEKAERPLVLKVVTAPLISPFSFSSSLEEGMRSSVICSVIAGDPPVSLTWFRDGRLLREASPDVQVVPITDFVSSLIINRVSRHHAGNYTCFAANAAASTNYTATMVVRAPPVWVIKPSDQSALEGMSVTFDCQSEGQPRPVVRWKYGKADDGSFQSILSSSHIHVLENGSLTITVAQKSDGGYYMCETSNDVGEPLRYSVRLSVNSAPQIQTSTQVVHVRKGEEARFSCSATGDLPLSIVWSREGFPLTLYPENRYNTRESENRGMKISEVLITSTQRKDSDEFTCSATNPFGEDKTKVKLIVQEPPDPPKELKTLEVTSNSISLSWTPGHPGNNPIISFTISYRPDSEKWPEERSKRVVVSNVDTSATISGLKPVTSYHIHVTARNAIGQSLPSSDLTVTTNAEAPRTSPRQVKAIPLSSSSIGISWQQLASFMEKESYVDGYYIGFREIPSGGPFVYKTVNVKQGQTDANYTLVGLKRGVQYSIVVQAFNSQGAGPMSEPIIVQTSTIDPPEAPLLKIVDTTATSVSLSWEIKSTMERPITGFILTFKGSSGQWHENRLPASRQSFVLEGLQCGTQYQIMLAAFNGVGHGESSELHQITTNGRAPVAPDKSEFLRSNSSSVQLDLRTWLDDGCPISHLVVQYRPRGQRGWILFSNHVLTDQETLVISDLSPGTWHDLLVTAHSDAGTTDAEYRFATLTLTGATVPPLSATRAGDHFLQDPTVLVPILCAAVVLVVVVSVTAFVVVWKRRDPPADAPPSDIYSRGSGGRADDISMSSYGKAKGNSVYDSQREPLYYPLPYATTHVPSHDPPSTGHDPPQSLQRGRGPRISEHTYDVPLRVQRHPNVPLQQYSQLWANSRGLLSGKPTAYLTSAVAVEDYDVAIAMAEKYAAFRLSQTSNSDPLSGFQDEVCSNMITYDDLSMDEEEISETECDRDCNGVNARRKYSNGRYSRVGEIIAC